MAFDTAAIYKDTILNDWVYIMNEWTCNELPDSSLEHNDEVCFSNHFVFRVSPSQIRHGKKVYNE